MTSWMLWSVVFAAFLALATLAAERIAAQYGWPRRFIWMIAIATSMCVPAALAFSSSGSVVPTGDASGISAVVPSISFAPSADAWSLRLWIVLSGVVFLSFAYAIIAMRVRSARWLEADLHECRALVTHDVGPAVVGFLRPRVVVPQWALTLEESSRQLILRHEVEHVRARDPQAVFACGLLLVMLPWNLPLWWMVRRVRLAMELDCDARVVRGNGRSYEYGRVLLAVGERHVRSMPLAASLAGNRPVLESRIIAISSRRPRRPLLASIPFGVLAVLLLLAATRAPHPAPLNASALKDWSMLPPNVGINAGASGIGENSPSSSGDSDSPDWVSRTRAALEQSDGKSGAASPQQSGMAGRTGGGRAGGGRGSARGGTTGSILPRMGGGGLRSGGVGGGRGGRGGGTARTGGGAARTGGGGGGGGGAGGTVAGGAINPGG